ncbi:MAG: cation-translocating P-type ATPase [Leptospiraceae bacterium]|nr:cation-translocating P-type ATPase [Leptospiraceae bacterium]
MNPERAYRLSLEELKKNLGSDPATGLKGSEVRDRLTKWGSNQLEEKRKRPAILKFLDQFRSFLTAVLVGAGALAWAIGDLKDAAVILFVVFFNACLGFYQEHRAERTLSALRDMLVPRARVRRDGRVYETESSGIVPGDIVLLQAGEQVPADGRILEGYSLEVQEAALTGESLAVSKECLDIGEDVQLSDRRNMLYMNTMVSKGRCEILVVATGMKTEMGRIAGMLSDSVEARTPLQEQLDMLGKRLALMAIAIILLIFGITVGRGFPWAEAAMSSVALAVAAIPEGLPAVVTVTLAIGMWRMARKKAILKKLSAVETLGSTTVICTDKTGTLTLNQMTARAVWIAGRQYAVGSASSGVENAVLAPELREVLLPAALCNEATQGEENFLGDPTEAALLLLAQQAGVDPAREEQKCPRIAEIPFDSQYKFMATFHRVGDRVQIYAKGAPDVLLEKCNKAIHWKSDGGKQELIESQLDDNGKRLIEEQNERLAGDALRIIAVARRSIPASSFDSGRIWEYAGGWSFLGLIGLMDPPREEAREAIRKCKLAGIDVKMITGDHIVTASAVARELGLEGELLSGSDLDDLEEEELSKRIGSASVFARVSPQHKVKIVRALKKAGNVTAMTGDGVNDAPALKAADIGVSMGSGTAVTREAATLVLTDDNFVTIQNAVEEGRIIYDNIVKFVRFQLSTNIGAILTVLSATLLSLPNPFTAIQLLWINIIMDGPPAMSLGLEPARPGLMRQNPRRPGSHILTVSRTLRLFFYGLLMAAGTLIMYFYGLQISEAVGSTLAFTTFVLFQFFNVFNARAENETALNRNFFRNPRLWLALCVVLVLQLLAVHWNPAAELFSTTPLSWQHWLMALATASSIFFLDELFKLGQKLWARSDKD